jgi:pantoate--beta-alanine ligase
VCNELRTKGKLGFVPTMGALHEGHLDLMRYAQSVTANVVASIFVNPTQFGPQEDLARYPRDLAADVAACERAGVRVVFAPSPEQLYPPGDHTRIDPGPVAAGLCGKWRPGHFVGVCTVVSKFFNLVGESTAVFGRKDYQQWKVVQRMAHDLFFGIDVVGRRTVREEDGLALSSRNRYLSTTERRSALGIVRGLGSAQRAFLAGERGTTALMRRCQDELDRAGLQTQYVELVDADDLSPPGTSSTGPRALLAVAAFAGKTRLIDNCVLGEDAALDLALTEVGS